ncbi:MAG: aspartate aminotransferase family protein [Bacteroidaceae bacterium]|nr:aspartate aminotransferase family protein [Bacteroidaceae bacterium]
MNLFDVYPLYPIEPVRGKGNYVYDAEGQEYLDLYGGHAVISIGHAHPHYVDAIAKQAASLGFYSNSVENSLQREFASRLGKACGYEDYSLFLCNSGAEANENAIKLASYHSGKKKVLAFSHAFHGRTSGTVAITDNPKIVSPFNVTDNVEFARFNDLQDAEDKLKKGDFCAVIVEGIQGVAGIQMPTEGFLRGLRELATEYRVSLILDEIQSGYGRSGKFFAHQWAGIRPDIITVAKGIANGFPMGGVLISPDFKPWHGMLGTTFGGNHLACAAALAVLDVIEKEKLIENANKVGGYILSELAQIDGLKEVRGKGLMIGIELDKPVGELRRRLLFEKHIFTGGAGVSTLRLLPALSIGRKEADCFLKAFKELINE